MAKNLSPALARVIDTDCVTGSSGAGVLTGAGEIEGDHGVAVMVFATDRFFARPFIFEPLRGNEAKLGETFGGFLAKAQDEKSLMLLFPDTYNGNAQNLLQAIAGARRFSSDRRRRLVGERRGGGDLSVMRRQAGYQLARRYVYFRRSRDSHRHHARLPADHPADDDHQGEKQFDP